MMGQVRSVKLDLDPGLVAAYRLRGRTDLDMTGWDRGLLLGTCVVVFDHDTQGGGELGHWEVGDLRAIRLQANGTSNRSLTIDMMLRYITTPNVLESDDEQQTISLSGELRVDTTAAENLLSIVVENAVAAW